MVKLVNAIKAIMPLVVAVLNAKKASNLMDLNVQEYQNLYNAIKLIPCQSKVNVYAEMALIYTMVIVLNVHILQFGMDIIVKVMLMLV
jgi:ribosomal silencing factor RsfS